MPATTPSNHAPYVLMLPKWYPNAVQPFNGNFIEKHCLAISTRINVVVLHIQNCRDTPEKKMVVKVVAPGMVSYTYYFRDFPGFTGKILNPLNFFRHQINGFKEIRKKYGLPVIQHAHVAGRNLLIGILLRKRHSVPLILSEHWSGYAEDLKKIGLAKKWRLKWLYSNLDCVTAVSEFLARNIIKLVGSRNISIIPNVVSAVFFEKSHRSVQLNGKKILLHIANIDFELKQNDKLVKAIAKLGKSREDFILRIIGKGKDLEKLKSTCAGDNFLSTRTEFLDEIAEEKIADEISGCGAVVMYSKIETQGVVLLECLATGTPFVAPSTGGIPEHCNSRGILFEPNDEQAFIAGITKILDGKIIHSPKEWSEYALNNFSSGAVALKFIAEYQKLVKEVV